MYIYIYSICGGKLLIQVNTFLVMSDIETVYSCIECGQTVRPRQEAIECESCSLWQHRTCNTNITRGTYRKAVRGEEELQWQCTSCSDLMNFQLQMDEELPLLESTRLSSRSSEQNDHSLVNDEVNVFDLPVGHPNPTIVPLTFDQFQSNGDNSSTFNGLLDGTEFTDVSNLDTNICQFFHS